MKLPQEAPDMWEVIEKYPEMLSMLVDPQMQELVAKYKMGVIDEEYICKSGYVHAVIGRKTSIIPLSPFIFFLLPKFICDELHVKYCKRCIRNRSYPL